MPEFASSPGFPDVAKALNGIPNLFCVQKCILLRNLNVSAAVTVDTSYVLFLTPPPHPNPEILRKIRKENESRVPNIG